MSRPHKFWFAVDTLLGLVAGLLAVVMLAVFEKVAARVPTVGAYAIVVTWPAAYHDDLDLHVQDPSGQVAWYGSLTTGALHLEHDDLGDLGSDYGGQPNFERVVVRVPLPGEYVANVHVFNRRDDGPIPATVELWRLQGLNALVYRQRLTMRGRGDEQTAFRFTLGPAGVSGINRLPKSLLTSTPSPSPAAVP